MKLHTHRHTQHASPEVGCVCLKEAYLKHIQRRCVLVCRWAVQMWKPHGRGWEMLVENLWCLFPGISWNDKNLKILFVFCVFVCVSQVTGDEVGSVPSRDTSCFVLWVLQPWTRIGSQEMTEVSVTTARLSQRAVASAWTTLTQPNMLKYQQAHTPEK